MKKLKPILCDILNGAAGGAFIAAGSMAAIDYMERGPSKALLLAVLGIVLSIVFEYALKSRAAVCAVSLGLFLLGFFSNSEIIKCLASGFVIYAGCALALPEKNVFTDAVTAASASVGFMAVLIAML